MERLRRRADFVAAAKALRAGTRPFLLQVRIRDDDPGGPPRCGFTVTRKVGTAVERNRIKRRLRALVDLHPAMAFRSGFDYVLVARRDALSVPFDELKRELASALRRAHVKGDQGPMNETAGP